MNINFSLLVALFISVSSCQVTTGGDETDTQTQTETETQVQVETQLPASTSTILANRVSEANYSLDISELNYQSLFLEYSNMFVDVRQLYDEVTAGDYVVAVPDLIDVNGAQRDVEYITYDCPVSGSLTITRGYESVDGVRELIYELTETDLCQYEDANNQTQTWVYESSFSDDITYESFTYETLLNEIVSVDSAYMAQGDQSLLEVYVSHEYYGRFLVRAENEFQIDETISMYGDNDTSVLLLNTTVQKDTDEPCYVQDVQHYSLNSAPSFEVAGDYANLCVSGFDESEDYNYQLTDTFEDDLSVISYTLSVVNDNSIVRSVFTLDNDYSLIELTIVHNDEVVYFGVDNIIEDPITDFDSGNYHFYFRNISFFENTDRLFVQIKTDASFIVDNGYSLDESAQFKSEETAVWGNDSGIEKDAPGNIRKQITVLNPTTYYFRLTSETRLYLYLSDDDETVLYDDYDIFRLSDTQYYFSAMLDVGTYYLDIGADNPSNDSRVIIELDENPYN